MKFSIRHVLSYILLSSIILLTVPREWVHECHQNGHEIDYENEDSFEEDDCFICDLDVTLDGISELSLARVISMPISFLEEREVKRYAKETCVNRLYRGPPVAYVLLKL